MPTNRHFSVMAAALGDDARQAIATSRSMGFDGLLFDAHSQQLNLSDLSGTGRREFTHILKSNGQTPVAIRADIGPKGFGPGADLDRLLSGLDRVLQVARDLNAGAVTIDLGPLPEPVEPVKPKSRITPEQAGIILIPGPRDIPTDAKTQAAPTGRPADPAFIAHVDGALQVLCEIAERYQVQVALRSSLSGFASVDRAMNSVRCPWFGINLDPVAILHDRWSVDEIFSRFGNSILQVLARDAIRGDGGRTKPMPVSEGNVEWDKLLAALDAAAYRGWITFDPSDLPNPIDALRTGLARLKS
ncbi:MAG: TIM barrel protein [Anaerolineae bacterium]|nr:TIM barrel protein [Phycisphaerae bacterium]